MKQEKLETLIIEVVRRYYDPSKSLMAPLTEIIGKKWYKSFTGTAMRNIMFQRNETIVHDKVVSFWTLNKHDKNPEKIIPWLATQILEEAERLKVVAKNRSTKTVYPLKFECLMDSVEEYGSAKKLMSFSEFSAKHSKDVTSPQMLHSIYTLAYTTYYVGWNEGYHAGVDETKSAVRKKITAITETLLENLTGEE